MTGGGGMLASSISRAWIVLRPDDRLTLLSRRDLDLRNADLTRSVFSRLRPDVVIHTAGMVGGIADKLARPLPYLVDNLRIDTSVLEAVVQAEVPSYLYTASAAAYPVAAKNPISESALFEGRLESANESYGLAKLAGLSGVGYAARQTGAAYRAILPSNLYGPDDTFEPTRAHLVASTLRKTHLAKEEGSRVAVWGAGMARREFTFAPDIARWLASHIEQMSSWPLMMNVGSGVDHRVRDLYAYAAEIVGYDRGFDFDVAQPEGVQQRLIDSSVARSFGWVPETSIHDGMAICYGSFLVRSENGEFR
ncbi:MAG: NAD-dependent epimerase/dehydratase family protein [Microbacterium sp.]|nr:NAD-dependent epimerase/dehydratase family protein [Microbacterium sp.]MDO8383194.1 NAD-dependent epimerase/dehydratase family protein [Microbacterium sp.]